MSYRFVVPCLFGLESIVAAELNGMGAENVVSENGRVLFSGDFTMMARANLSLRCGERVLLLAGEFEARSFEELFDQVRRLPWEQYIGMRDEFPVTGYSLRSKLFSVRDCQSIIKKAVVERLKSKYGVSWFEETGARHMIRFAILKDRASVMLDTSGVGLYKRGYRLESNDAPIKETLAAAMCSLARLREYHTLYDPLCGSGTILTEGALMALNIAPGLKRSFISERWENVGEAVFNRERERARELIRRDVPFRAYGSDIDAKAIESALGNAKRAGVADRIEFSVQDVRFWANRSDRGTVITNPPYGERLLDIEQAEQIIKILGEKFDKKRGWSYYIISPSDQFETLFGRRADKRRKLYNGMMQCQLFMYYK